MRFSRSAPSIVLVILAGGCGGNQTVSLGGPADAQAESGDMGGSSGTPSGSGGGSSSSSGNGSSSSSGSASSSGSGSSSSSGSGSSSSSGSGSGSSSSSGSGSSSGSVVDNYSGPFKVLVLSKTLNLHHDSIPAGQQMLRDLGKCVDAASCAMTNDVAIAGAQPNSSFTVDVAGAPANCPAATPNNYASYAAMGCDGSTTDLSQFTAANLKNYQMVFFMSPNGTVFSSGGSNGRVGMAAIQAFVEGGGAFGSVHAACDLEDMGSWPWYYNTLFGAFFVSHNADNTPGSVTTEPMYATHPVMRGLPSPLSAMDEWYYLDRPISAQPGFQVLATLSGAAPVAGEPAGDMRAVVWIKQFPVAADPTREGRMFNTIRGHNIIRYGETDFRQLVHQGILWATHRLN